MNKSYKKPEAVDTVAECQGCEHSARSERMHRIVIGDAQRGLADIETRRTLPAYEALTELQNTRISRSN